MKLFIDTADIDEIKEAYSLGIIDGITTNPSLIAKTGKNFESVINEICSIVDGPISVEALSKEYNDIIEEAHQLSKISKNIVIKIPITDQGLKAVKRLSQEDIPTNVTLIFSPAQALLAAKAGATYVSPFIGRLDDISHIGMDVVDQIITIYNNYDIQTEVIVASVRNPLHILDAALLGADIVTIPFRVIQQLTKHPLTDIGMERFLVDWEKVPKKKGG
ncbi:MAG: fructose-6-phosphate aldolase [Nitrospinae bacterium]|nr:fructose-6-phosphate aldolase [Nitrospinota bacterium]